MKGPGGEGRLLERPGQDNEVEGGGRRFVVHAVDSTLHHADACDGGKVGKWVKWESFGGCSFVDMDFY